mmetsp:Transcript_7780/g.17948  ORF Transcript_7780/g.17948 Transcript_7780/m.17948 type:complete len:106 (+) Transcript_7780:1966-2283(+)
MCGVEKGAVVVVVVGSLDDLSGGMEGKEQQNTIVGSHTTSLSNMFLLTSFLELKYNKGMDTTTTTTTTSLSLVGVSLGVCQIAVLHSRSLSHTVCDTLRLLLSIL